MNRPQRKSVHSWTASIPGDHLQGCMGRTLALCIPGQNPTTEEPGLKGTKPHLNDQRKWNPTTMTRSEAKHYLHVNLVRWTHHSLICDPGHACHVHQDNWNLYQWLTSDHKPWTLIQKKFILKLLLVLFWLVGSICDCTNTGKILIHVSRQPHGSEIIWTTHEGQMTGTQLGVMGGRATPRKSSVSRSRTTAWPWVWSRTCTTTVMSTHYNTLCWLFEEWKKDKGHKLTSRGPASFLITCKSGQD